MVYDSFACVLQEPTSQSGTLEDAMHSSVQESAVDMSGPYSMPAADVDHLTCLLSASRLSSSENAAANRCRNISVMIPVRATQPLPAYQQSAARHDTQTSDSAQLVV